MGAVVKTADQENDQVVKNILIIVVSSIFIYGCRSKIEEVAEKSAAIVFVMLIASIGYLTITPKLQQWEISKKIIQYFIYKFSLIFILIMIFAGVVCLIFWEGWISTLLAVNFFISSTYLYKLKMNYNNKSENQRISDLRYFTITLPSIIALAFLLFGGLQKVLK